MRRILSFTAIFIFYAFACVWCTIINVPVDYPTIQQGIDASTNGDTVLVQPGTYVENINYNGDNIVLGSLFLTTGDTSYISSTIIDGDSAGSVVTFESGEDSTAIITGFTIQNGLASYGGGIYCYMGASPTINYNAICENSAYQGAGGISCVYSSPTISNNTISGNTAPQYGGGIVCGQSSATISNNTISGNSASCGGGIQCLDSNPTISFNNINGNTATNTGGGILCNSSDAAISNNTIYGNSADNYGGGIYCYNCSSTISSNTISGNSAGGGGGGIYFSDSGPAVSNNTISGNSTYYGGGIFCDESSPTISNNTINGNSANNYGGGIYFQNSSPTTNNNTISINSANFGGGIYCWQSNPVIANTIFWGDSASNGPEIHLYGTSSPVITYCDVQGGWTGVGNIDCDPMFCDPDSNNFYLADSSCCVGAGQGGVDIGAFGIGCYGDCEYTVGDVNGSDSYNGLDITYGVAFFKGGNPPQCPECALCPDWHYCGDVNGSCNYNGLDITYGVAYFKGGSAPVPCQDCPPNLLFPAIPKRGD